MKDGYTDFRFRCGCGTCKIVTRNNIDPSITEYVMSDGGTPVERAGAFVHTSNPERMVLIVQSYGWKWGPPKGKVESDETYRMCAIRETFEETGIDITSDIISDPVVFIKKWHMYDVHLDHAEFKLPKCDEITGIGWVSVDCILRNKKVMNHPFKLCIRRFLKVDI